MERKIKMLNQAESKLLSHLIWELDTRGTRILEATFGSLPPMIQELLLHNMRVKRHINIVIDGKKYADSEAGCLPIISADGHIVNEMKTKPATAGMIDDCALIRLSNCDGRLATEFYLIRCADHFLKKKSTTSPEPKKDSDAHYSTSTYYRLLRIALEVVRQRFVTFFHPIATLNNWEKFNRLKPNLFFKMWFVYRNKQLFSSKIDPLENDIEFVGRVGEMLFQKNQNLDELALLTTM